MDSHNLFCTRATSRLLRAEYAMVVVFAILLFVAHIHQVRLWVFAALFLSIDLLGYLPGAIAWRRAGGRPISHTYYMLYNVTHSLLTACAVAGIWWLVGHAEWALLALPIHLGGDRALFGNFPKPFGLSFEPSTHPAYEEFVSRYEHASPDGPELAPARSSVPAS